MIDQDGEQLIEGDDEVQAEIMKNGVLQDGGVQVLVVIVGEVEVGELENDEVYTWIIKKGVVQARIIKDGVVQAGIIKNGAVQVRAEEGREVKAIMKAEEIQLWHKGQRNENIVQT